MKTYKLLIFIISLWSCAIASDIKQLSVESVSQTLIDDHNARFDGQVEVLIDRKLHVWADHVIVDKKAQELFAWADVSGAVILEDDRDTVIMASTIVLNFMKKTGWAKDLTIRVPKGYISTSKAEKGDDQSWHMHDMVYTPCDAPTPHWYLKAQRASLYPSGLLKTSGLVFKVGQTPLFWLPRLTVPAQGQSKSGFLMPKFSYDYEAGVGIKQEFYKYFTPHLDTTLSVDWRDHKGIVIADELRWAHAPHSVTLINAHYARVKNVFRQKRNRIIVSSENRYWVHGSTVRSFDYFAPCQVSRLARMDFGTDKRISYIFSNDTDDIDDMFSNSFIARAVWPNHMYECRINGDETSRTYFLPLSQNEKKQQAEELVEAYKANPDNPLFDQTVPVTVAPLKARETKVEVVELPHLSGASCFYSFADAINYRHDFFVDQMSYRQQENERYFADKFVIDNDPIIPFDKAGVLRVYYQGHINKTLQGAGSALSWSLYPQLQIRSKTQHHVPRHQHNVLEKQRFGFGAYRCLVTSDLTWSLPSLTTYNRQSDAASEVTPRITWSFIPKFYQQHWYDMDRYDRVYPKNECALSLDGHWDIDDHVVDATVTQAYDFYRSDDWFALRRGATNTHLCPLRTDLTYGCEETSLSLIHDHDWATGNLLQISVNAATTFKKAVASIGYLYQSSPLQQHRQLLSTIPHFVLMNYVIPLGQYATFSYDGQFCAEKGAHFLSLKPIVHRLRFDYQGHCWGFYVGFEEKKYREYGVPKTEHYIVFALRLETLGSFAKKIRPIMPEHEKVQEPLLQA